MRKRETRINHARLIQVINGEVQPQTPAEEFFLKFHIGAISGKILAELLSTYMDILIHLDREEVWHFIIGYAKGQQSLEENDQELFASINDEKKTTH